MLEEITARSEIYHYISCKHCQSLMFIYWTTTFIYLTSTSVYFSFSTCHNYLFIFVRWTDDIRRRFQGCLICTATSWKISTVNIISANIICPTLLIILDISLFSRQLFIRHCTSHTAICLSTGEFKHNMNIDP